jgi:hypothetical protein
LIPSGVTGRPAALRRGRLIGFAAKNPFQPAHKTAGLFLGLDVRRAVLNWLVLPRLKLPVVTAGLARLEPAGLTRVSLAAFAGGPGFTRFKWPATLTALATLARGLEGPALIRPRRGFGGGAGGRICLPAKRGTARILRRQDVEFRFGGIVRRRRMIRPCIRAGGLGAFGRRVGTG